MQGSVEVSYNGCKYSNLKIHVVDWPFPPLLGRDWIRMIFGKDWLNRFVTRQVRWLEGCNTSAVLEQDSGSSIMHIYYIFISTAHRYNHVSFNNFI